ncbi:MAG TPA: hypothetical protein VMR52_04520 [Dehalococcoidia bacterium]|nr:hypothetical protein [Dehalococcoidia bacterium]
MTAGESLYPTESRRFNLARPRLWFELIGLALTSLEVALYFVTDLKTEYLVAALPVNVLLLIGGYMVWRPLNYLFVKPDGVEVRSWSFSGGLFGKNTDKRQVYYDEVQELGADNGTGTLWLRYDPTRWRQEGEPDPGGEIKIRISPPSQAGVAGKLIQERRDRVRPFLDQLDTRLEAARDEGGRLLGYPSPPPTVGEDDAASK